MVQPRQEDVVQLTPFGQAFGGHHCTGYVWSQHTGWRIIIVVDDWFDLPNWAANEESLECPSAHAYGLEKLWDELPKLTETRAIGFFSSPDPDSNTFEQDTRQIVSCIQQWLIQIIDETCHCYLLVDYFYGEGVKGQKNSGIRFVQTWQESLKIWQNNLTSRPSLIETGSRLPLITKVAHLSVSGGSVSNPYNLPVFSKVEIQITQGLPLKLREWLDINEHPLTRLWRISADWFAVDHDGEPMKHTTGKICQCFKDPTCEQALAYRRNIEEALGFQLPNEWWQNSESVGNLHEALKCLCGSLACSQTDANAKRTLSTGAAFLIALMAHQQECKTLGVMVKNPKLWLNCCHVGTDSPIFAKQDRAIAEASARALYDFFRQVFQVRDRSGVDGNVRQSQVERVGFLNQGKSLVIQLAWNAHQHAPDRQNSLAESMSELFQQERIQVPKFPPNTREALVKLWALMAISETGCFAPGTIYLDGKTLTIASTK